MVTKKKSIPKPEAERKRSWTFKDVPNDIADFLFDQQIKIRRASPGLRQYGIDKVNYKLLRSHPDFPKNGK